MRAFEYRHTVSFEDTNALGNVYYTNHVRWQGRCREMFLREHAPDLLAEVNAGLRLVTTRVACEYLEELFAFDEVVIRMHATDVTQSRVTMTFEYLRVTEAGEQLVALGEQQIACLRLVDGRLAPAPVPRGLREALARFR